MTDPLDVWRDMGVDSGPELFAYDGILGVTESDMGRTKGKKTGLISYQVDYDVE